MKKAVSTKELVIEFLSCNERYKQRYPNIPVALPLEGDADGADFGGVKVLPLFQFVDDEVEKFAPVTMARVCQRQDVPFQPADQGFDILGEAPLDGLVVARLRQCQRQGVSLPFQLGLFPALFDPLPSGGMAPGPCAPADWPSLRTVAGCGRCPHGKGHPPRQPAALCAPRARVGDGVVGIQPLRLGIQQMHTPRVTVMVFSL